MITTFAVDKNGDLIIGADGNLVLLSGLAAVLQSCEQRVKTLLGEMIYQVNDGIPYFQTVWVGSPNYDAFQVAVTNAIIKVSDVIEVSEFTAELIDNVLNYQVIIRTTFGEGVVSGAV